MIRCVAVVLCAYWTWAEIRWHLHLFLDRYRNDCCGKGEGGLFARQTRASITVSLRRVNVGSSGMLPRV